MSDMNMVAIMGRLTRDAEMKTAASGKSFVQFSIAVKRTRKQGEEYVSIPNFFNLFHFGKAAEGIFPYLKKGQLVAIQGHLEQRTWEQQGEKRSSTEIVIDKLNLAGWRRDAGMAMPYPRDESEAAEEIAMDEEDLLWSRVGECSDPEVF